MAITLSDHTQDVIESRMKEWGFNNADELVLTAVQRLEDDRGVPYEELDAGTRAAIEEAELQEGIPWETVRDELKQRFGLK
jgi:Arc/MetJ-type ribon-helix-helix transcriptional regulator